MREAELERSQKTTQSAKPGSIALLVNPSTTTGPRDIADVHHIASRLSAVDFAMTSRDDPGGASMLEPWFRRGVRAIAVIGGDGTLRSVLTAVHRAGRTRDFDIVLLDGGSFGLTARMFGARDAWKRVLDAHNRSEPLRYRSLELPTLMTADGLGFLVGAGAGASVSRDFQSAQRKGNQLLGYIATRTLDAVLGDSISLLDGYRGALAYDGKSAPGKRWIAIFVTSLPQFVRKSDANSPSDACLYSLALRFDGKPDGAPKLIDMVAGRWASETRVSREVQLESLQPFDVLLDGEIQTVGEVLAVRPGPTFRAWVPSAVEAPGLVWPSMPFGQLLEPERILTRSAHAAGHVAFADNG